jgi:hypothetical protein
MQVADSYCLFFFFKIMLGSYFLLAEVKSSNSTRRRMMSSNHYHSIHPTHLLLSKPVNWEFFEVQQFKALN